MGQRNFPSTMGAYSSRSVCSARGFDTPTTIRSGWRKSLTAEPSNWIGNWVTKFENPWKVMFCASATRRSVFDTTPRLAVETAAVDVFT